MGSVRDCTCSRVASNASSRRIRPSGVTSISASSVTIDLGGHTVGGNGSRDGIQSQPPPATVLSDITIKNGTLQHFSDAIDLSDSNNPVIDGVKAIENGRDGILVSSTNPTVRNSIADKNVSVGIRTGNFATLEGNTSTNNEYGVWGSCPSTLTNNKTHGNSSMDIYLVNDPKRCTMNGNTGDKISK